MGRGIIPELFLNSTFYSELIQPFWDKQLNQYWSFSLLLDPNFSSVPRKIGPSSERYAIPATTPCSIFRQLFWRSQYCDSNRVSTHPASALPDIAAHLAAVLNGQMKWQASSWLSDYKKDIIIYKLGTPHGCSLQLTFFNIGLPPIWLHLVQACDGCALRPYAVHMAYLISRVRCFLNLINSYKIWSWNFFCIVQKIVGRPELWA